MRNFNPTASALCSPRKEGKKNVFKIIKRAVSVVPALVFALQEIAPAQSPCPRYAAGSMVSEPGYFYSKDGAPCRLILPTKQFRMTPVRPTFVPDPRRRQSPTLHVQPGHTLEFNPDKSRSGRIRINTVQLQWHCSKAGEGHDEYYLVVGQYPLSCRTNTPPICHQDEVIHTIVNSGHTFDYEVHIPKDGAARVILVSPSHSRIDERRRARRSFRCSHCGRKNRERQPGGRGSAATRFGRS